MANEAKPECAVRGLVRPGAMCSKVIVGQKLCGFTGQCEHQRPQREAAPEPGCDYCRNPLFASLKCPGCGRTATNGRG